HRREPDAPRHDRSNPIALRETVALEEQRLIFLQTIRLPELCADARPVVALDPAGVGDLAAALRIERRFAQLREEEPVAKILECTDLRERLGLLVTHEFGAKAGALGELGCPLVVLRDRPTGTRPLQLHQPSELFFVDAEPALPCELTGQLERETVGVVQAERVLARDGLVPLCNLLEESQSAL